MMLLDLYLKSKENLKSASEGNKEESKESVYNEDQLEEEQEEKHRETTIKRFSDKRI